MIWIIPLATLISFCIAIITLRVVHRRSAPRPLPIPYDGPSRLEKFGVDVHAAAASDEPGHDWSWVQGQFAGREYWLTTCPTAPRVCVRRKCWPIAYFKKGMRLASDYVIDRDFVQVWHIWASSEGWTSFAKGWGGQMGADHDDDDFVVVNGQRETDGTGYRPSAEDLAATDWELVP